MQQVFTIMNSLLKENKDTLKRRLLIRTYKVICVLYLKKETLTDSFIYIFVSYIIDVHIFVELLQVNKLGFQHWNTSQHELSTENKGVKDKYVPHNELVNKLLDFTNAACTFDIMNHFVVLWYWG